MITAFIAALLLMALGIAAKGVIAHALVIAGAWITKNILLLGFLRTPTGKRTARAIRGGAYSRLGGPGRRTAYRFFGFLSRIENAIGTLFSRAKKPKN